SPREEDRRPGGQPGSALARAARRDVQATIPVRYPAADQHRAHSHGAAGHRPRADPAASARADCGHGREVIQAKPDTRLTQQRTKTGRVSSNKMNKTVVVEVELVTRHRLYGRTLRRTPSLQAHDEANRCEIGDTVLIAESRPISKDKHWVVRQILRRGTGEPVEIQDIPGED